jgi:hypothetical protein
LNAVKIDKKNGKKPVKTGGFKSSIGPDRQTGRSDYKPELASYLRVTNFPSVFNCPLLPSPQNNLAGKRPMTPKFLATPLCASVLVVFFFVTEIKKRQ